MDLVCMGRVAVDLYARQAGTSLAEARSFDRAVGGSSANVALAAARLGARVAMLGRVGDDPMGCFARNSLAEAGVDVRALNTDPTRRTALAFLGMDGPEATGLDFYRADPADMALSETDVPEALIERARLLAVCGTQFAAADGASFEAVTARFAAAGAQIVLDIDLRHALWAAAPGGILGARDRVARIARRAAIVVGNEEELCVLGDADDLMDALRGIRAIGPARILAKLGEAGVAIVDGDVPVDRESLAVTPAAPVRAVNPVGAGDAFLGAYLAAHLEGAAPERALRHGTIAGAIVAARAGCAVAMPAREEIEAVETGMPADAPALGAMHARAVRGPAPLPILALACDHRVPFAELSAATDRGEAEVRAFKQLVVEAARDGAARAGCDAPAMFLDPHYAGNELERLTNEGWWTCQPAEITGSRPVRFEFGDDLFGEIAALHPRRAVKCLVWHHPDDPADLVETQFATLRRLQAACENAGLTLVLELVPPQDGPSDDATVLISVEQAYAAGLTPGLWKLPAPTSDAAWGELAALIRSRDPHCDGVLVLGLAAPFDKVADGLALAGRHAVCAGFAVGRTIFGEASRRWFEGACTDDEVREEMATIYARLIDVFSSARDVSAHEAEASARVAAQ